MTAAARGILSLDRQGVSF